jgi:ABC-type sulfate/molybdate transport systems ATPase subunit
VTHDVDEALFLSDRVVMMTNGPAATIGEILEVKFPRPRSRQQLLEDPLYYELREQLIGFLEERSHLRPAAPTGGPLPPPRHAAPVSKKLRHFFRAPAAIA